MSEKDQLREDLLSKIKKSHPPTHKVGGFNLNGPISNRVILEIEEIGLIVQAGSERSQVQNYELARVLVELAVDHYLDKLYKNENKTVT
jgi:hypothetical protein